ncbi:MAG: ABC transporter substrate-binding protein, partial [bacterium]|nr:ABC transporter substrate-binding protein [bacterium]
LPQNIYLKSYTMTFEEDTDRGNIRMKQLWILVLLVLAAGCVIGCTGGKKKAPEVKPKGSYGGTLVLSTISGPKSFNDIIAKETSTTGAIGYLFEGLTKTDGVTTEVVPCLAKSWEFSQDGLVWTFHLRNDVTWFDGEPFTADDVIFTYNDLVFNESIPASARDIFKIDGQKPGIEKADDYTVVFTLSKPFVPLLRYLGQAILPEHVLRPAVEEGRFNSTWGVDTDPSKLIGTGPFKLIEFRQDERLVYERNPHYWKKDKEGNSLPYLERIVVQIVENQDVELINFESGELDIIGLRSKDYTHLKQKEKESNFTIYNCGPAFGTNFICFNQNPLKVKSPKIDWFTDPGFRKAVAHAIDKETIINNVLNGLGYPQTAAMSKAAVAFFNPKVSTCEYDLDKAANILSEAGYKDRDGNGIIEDSQGNPIKFTLLTNAENTVRKDIGTIIQADLKKLGMDTTFSPIDFNNLVTRLDASYDWEAILIGLTGGVDPHGGKNVWESSGHLHLWNPRPHEPNPLSDEEKADKKKVSEWEEKKVAYQKELAVWEEKITAWEREVDDIFNQGVSEMDPEKRKALYNRWQEIVAEQLPLIYTVNDPAIYAVRNKFGNLKPTAYGGTLHNIEEIYLARPLAATKPILDCRLRIMER